MSVMHSFHKEFVTLRRSSLVPVFGFGQNDGYQQPFFTNKNLNFEWLKSYKKSKPTALEKWSKVVASSILMAFGGNYIPGLPYKTPITVVGKIAGG